MYATFRHVLRLSGLATPLRVHLRKTNLLTSSFTHLALNTVTLLVHYAYEAKAFGTYVGALGGCQCQGAVIQIGYQS
jgi:hypothetical protein